MAANWQLELARLAPDGWREFRAVRIAALTDAPSAFGSTLAGELLLDERDWRARLAHRAQFVVRCGEEAMGTVGGVAKSGPESGSELVSLWVHPDWRGRGVGDLLVEAVLAWVRERGHRGIGLWVSDGNNAAERLYARHGFVRTGESQPVEPADPSRLEFAMARSLEGDSPPITTQAGLPGTP